MPVDRSANGLLLELRSAVAALAVAPLFEKPALAQDAVVKALALLEELDRRVTVLEDSHETS